jgi:hypothetical protein
MNHPIQESGTRIQIGAFQASCEGGQEPPYHFWITQQAAIQIKIAQNLNNVKETRLTEILSTSLSSCSDFGTTAVPR